ncbi:flagellar hook-associated protein FlgK [Legionella sp. CNM-4043-24]|uniref:flagellar hook-associated protein FlgK n=1 Tax=Legionella sp. CNM-4043-24 TaxID=3421646 RepID=UPI00403AD115
MRSLMDIGVHSLMAYQYAMSITGKNITNKDVASYSRRDVIFSEAFNGMFGNGVSVADTRRVFDDSANRNVQLSNSSKAKSDVYLQNLKDFEVLFDENSYSISTYINDSLTALNVINTNPGSAQTRDTYLYQMQNIAARFNAIDNNIALQQKGLNTSIQANVDMVNNLTESLARMNSLLPMAADGERADLLDQRDEILSSLSQYLSFESSADDNGAVTIELSNGTPLVLGSDVSRMVTYPAADDPSRLELAVLNNGSRITVTRLINSGELGGLMQYQSAALEESRNALGRLAIVLAQKLNAQNALGMDLNGNLGGNIFTDINQSDAMRHRVINNTGNIGSGVLSIQIDDATQLTGSDYEVTFDSPTHYQVIRKSDHQVIGDSSITSFPASMALDGFVLKIDSGSFVAGDKFTLAPTRYAASEISVEMTNASKLALAMPVATSASQSNSGEGTISLTAVTDTRNPAFIMSGYLNPPIRVEFTSTVTYRLVNANDNSILEDNISYDPVAGTDVFPTGGGIDPGYRVNLSGNMSVGDEFYIEYNSDGAGDNRNGLLLAQLYQTPVLEKGTLTFAQAYQSLSDDISRKTAVAERQASTNNTIKIQADARRDQISGVSELEEFMNLTRFQESMEASAQIIEAGQKVFETIIGLSRR